MKLAIVIPTFNERENIVPLVKKILSIKKDALIIIVDDASPDGTGTLADRLSKTRKNVFVIHRPKKQGLGSAYKAGFELALKKKHGLICTMDADLSHDPSYLPRMLTYFPKYDIVIGSRHTRGGKIVGFSLSRSLLSSIAQALSKTILGIQIYDSTSGFRIYKSGVIKKIGYKKIKSEGYSFLIEALFIAIKKGFLVFEAPIVFSTRKRGTSKISQKEILKGGLTIIRLFLERD